MLLSGNGIQVLDANLATYIAFSLSNLFSLWLISNGPQNKFVCFSIGPMY